MRLRKRGKVQMLKSGPERTSPTAAVGRRGRGHSRIAARTDAPWPCAPGGSRHGAADSGPQKRTIATSRSEATTTEPKPENETTARRRESLGRLAPSKGDVRLALALRSHPKENRFRLTSSFRNGPLFRRAQVNPCNLLQSATPTQVFQRELLTRAIVSSRRMGREPG